MLSSLLTSYHLQQTGGSVAATFIDINDPSIKWLEEEFGVRSAGSSLLLMVEGTIALGAIAFIGSPSSSATWMLAQERVAEWTDGGTKSSGDRKDFMFNEKLEPLTAARTPRSGRTRVSSTGL